MTFTEIKEGLGVYEEEMGVLTIRCCYRGQGSRDGVRVTGSGTTLPTSYQYMIHAGQGHHINCFILLF